MSDLLQIGEMAVRCIKDLGSLPPIHKDGDKFSIDAFVLDGRITLTGDKLEDVLADFYNQYQEIKINYEHRAKVKEVVITKQFTLFSRFDLHNYFLQLQTAGESPEILLVGNEEPVIWNKIFPLLKKAAFNTISLESLVNALFLSFVDSETGENLSDEPLYYNNGDGKGSWPIVLVSKADEDQYLYSEEGDFIPESVLRRDFDEEQQKDYSLIMSKGGYLFYVCGVMEWAAMEALRKELDHE